jgi:hypothetical protein
MPITALDEMVWAEELFGGCELGDPRRTRRLVEYAARQAGSPESSSHAVCGGDGALKEGTFRFLRNEHVHTVAILEGGCRVTAARCDERSLVFACEDSTTVNYTHGVSEQLGSVGGIADKQTRGFVVHSVLAVDGSNGEIMGLLNQNWWTREPKPPQASKKALPYEDSEAFKWQRSSEQIRQLTQRPNNLLWICDREADIHEYVEHKCAHAERFIVRAAQNRSVAEDHGRLWEHMQAQPLLYERQIKIQQRGKQVGPKPRPNRPARDATVQVRRAAVTLTPKCKKPGKKNGRRFRSMLSTCLKPRPPRAWSHSSGCC